MQVSFIIPLFNCLGHTRECLRTLQATLPPGLTHEIILVDDGSTDGTREWLADQGASCRVLLNENNLGFASTCNRGAAAATGELLFFLNNDLLLLPGWFEPMRSAFAHYPDAGLVGNVQRNAATDAVDHAGIYFAHTGKPAHDTTRPLLSRLTGYRTVPAVTGACLAIRRDRWLEFGGFDTAFVNGGEDVDLALRAAGRNLRHYVALRSEVRHHVSASTGRKLRDEQNSRLLATRWREVILPLAGRDWCREFIERHWDLSCLYDDTVAREALYYWLGLLPENSSGVMAGVRLAMRHEEQRWNQLLGPNS